MLDLEIEVVYVFVCIWFLKRKQNIVEQVANDKIGIQKHGWVQRKIYKILRKCSKDDAHNAGS